MKKLYKTLVAFLGVATLAACGANTTNTTQTQTQSQPQTVKVAVVGNQAKEVWDFVAEKAKAENINLEVIEMSDYVTPNTALEEGSIDMNAFQHRAYLKQWNDDHQTKLTEIGVTYITPLFFFSNKYKSLGELPEGAKVVIPSEVAIQGRALVALQTAGLIELSNGGSTHSSVADVTSNPRNIELIELPSAQAVGSLADVDAASVNGSMAIDAGMKLEDNIFSDADYLDTIPTDRFNIIVVKEENAQNETYLKIVKLFQSEDVVQKLNEVASGLLFPVWER